MTTLTPAFGYRLKSREDPAERPAPEEHRRGLPVLMHDCVTPIGGTTVLHALWRRWDAEKGEDQP